MLASKEYHEVEVQFEDCIAEMKIISNFELDTIYYMHLEQYKNHFMTDFNNWYVKNGNNWKLVDKKYKEKYFGETYKQLRDFVNEEKIKVIISKWTNSQNYEGQLDLKIEIVKIFGE